MIAALLCAIVGIALALALPGALSVLALPFVAAGVLCLVYGPRWVKR